MTASPAIERDEPERLSSVDDQATAQEALYLAAALDAQRLRAMRDDAGEPGICKNCDERCLPTAVYCDAFCRGDHEARQRADRLRTGRGRA